LADSAPLPASGCGSRGRMQQVKYTIVCSGVEI
jgi:hypothetical protein